jgi:hypothetical protein
MSESTTSTQEFRSWEWELVLQYEDGSLPATSWNPATLTTVATWYAKNLTPQQATTRYEQHYHRNRHRLMHRLSEASGATDSKQALEAGWPSR